MYLIEPLALAQVCCTPFESSFVFSFDRRCSRANRIVSIKRKSYGNTLQYIERDQFNPEVRCSYYTVQTFFIDKPSQSRMSYYQSFTVPIYWFNLQLSSHFDTRTVYQCRYKLNITGLPVAIQYKTKTLKSRDVLVNIIRDSSTFKPVSNKDIHGHWEGVKLVPLLIYILPVHGREVFPLDRSHR